MNKPIIRLFVYIIIITLLISINFGCNVNKQVGKDQIGNGQDNMKLPTLKPVTLNFYFPEDSITEKPDAQIVLNEIEKRTNLNINLSFKWFKLSDYIQKIKAINESGDNVDAFICGKPDSELDFTQMARKGELKDITDLIKNYAPNLYKKYPQEELDAAMVDGKLVAIPSLFPLASSNCIVAREDYLLKYYIPDIKTYDDYSNYLKVVKDNEKNVIPGSISLNMIELFARPLGYIILDPNQWLVYRQDDPGMRICAWEQTPAYKSAVNYIVSWYKNGYMALDNQDVLDPAKVSSCCLFGGMKYYEKGMTFNNPDGINQRIFLLNPDKKVYRSDPIGEILGNGALVFSAGSKNVERALMFLDWVQQSQENYDLFMYGIEGKNYKLLSDGMIRFVDGENYNTSSYVYWPGYTTFKNIEYERIFLSPADKQKQLNFFSNNTIYMPHEGFHPDYTKLDKITEGRANMVKDINDALCSGQFNIDDINKNIEDLTNQGSKEFVEAIQRQLDNWKKTLNNSTMQN